MTYLPSMITAAAPACQMLAAAPAGLPVVKIILGAVLILAAYAVVRFAWRAVWWQKLFRLGVSAVLVVVGTREICQALEIIGSDLARRGVSL